LLRYIEDNCIVKDSTDIKAIIKAGLSATSKLLDFSFVESTSDPNKLIESPKANCIGYAALFSTICDYQLERYHPGQWTVSHEIGQLYLLGTNIHGYFKSPFFKDHDFVVIKNATTNEVFAVDPSLNDYLHINFITLKN
jgi:hypothetical protein